MMFSCLPRTSNMMTKMASPLYMLLTVLAVLTPGMANPTPCEETEIVSTDSYNRCKNATTVKKIDLHGHDFDSIEIVEFPNLVNVTSDRIVFRELSAKEIRLPKYKYNEQLGNSNATFYVKDNSNLKSLSLNSTTMLFDLKVDRNPALANIQTRNLETVQDQILVKDCPRLSDIVFPELQTTKALRIIPRPDCFALANGSSLFSIQAPKLVEVSGNDHPDHFNLEISTQFNLTEIVFDKLERINGKVKIANNPKLRTISLPALETIGQMIMNGNESTQSDAEREQYAACSILINYQLEEISFPSLRTIGGFVHIHDNLPVRNINMTSLQHVSGALSVRNYGESYDDDDNAKYYIQDLTCHSVALSGDAKPGPSEHVAITLAPGFTAASVDTAVEFTAIEHIIDWSTPDYKSSTIERTYDNFYTSSSSTHCYISCPSGLEVDRSDAVDGRITYDQLAESTPAVLNCRPVDTSTSSTGFADFSSPLFWGVVIGVILMLLLLVLWTMNRWSCDFFLCCCCRKTDSDQLRIRQDSKLAPRVRMRKKSSRHRKGSRKNSTRKKSKSVRKKEHGRSGTDKKDSVKTMTKDRVRSLLFDQAWGNSEKDLHRNLNLDRLNSLETLSANALAQDGVVMESAAAAVAAAQGTAAAAAAAAARGRDSIASAVLGDDEETAGEAAEVGSAMEAAATAYDARELYDQRQRALQGGEEEEEEEHEEHEEHEHEHRIDMDEDDELEESELAQSDDGGGEDHHRMTSALESPPPVPEEVASQAQQRRSSLAEIKVQQQQGPRPPRTAAPAGLAHRQRLGLGAPAEAALAPRHRGDNGNHSAAASATLFPRHRGGSGGSNSSDEASPMGDGSVEVEMSSPILAGSGGRRSCTMRSGHQRVPSNSSNGEGGGHSRGAFEL